jgi:hypothetical protein
LIKDSTKHARKQHTSSKIKKIRDFQSSVEGVPGGLKVQKKDGAEILTYNMKTKNIEYKDERRALHRSDVN